MNNQDFKSFREIEKIARKQAPFTDETKIVEEKTGSALARYFESISWHQPNRPADQEPAKKTWKSAIKVAFGRFGSTHDISIEVDSMHGAQRRQESFYLSRPEVRMLIKFLQEVEPQLQDPHGEYSTITKLEKY